VKRICQTNLGRISCPKRRSRKIDLQARQSTRGPFNDDIVHRIKTLQATLDPDEKIALSVGGVAIDAVGLGGSTIWFQGRNNQGCAVVIAQHYTQVTVVMTAERLYRGEAPTQITFLTE